MELVLNEHSCHPAPNVYGARELMETLITVCRNAIKLGTQNSLRTKNDILHHLLAEHYKVYNWLNDNNVDKDLRRRFKSLVTKAPFIDEQLEQDLFHRFMCSEFKVGEDTVLGLGIARLLDGLSVSFANEERWDIEKVLINMLHYNDEGHLVDDEVEVKHASRLPHIYLHAEWIKSTKYISAREEDGGFLWEHKEELFPYLSFCDLVEGQVAHCLNGNPLYRQMIGKLIDINEYFSTWKEGPFTGDNFPCKVTLESEPTLQKYKREHIFICPDGKERIFSWHVRLTPYEWRIFFFPDPANRKAIIGHVGPKLPTVLYPK